MLMSGRQQHQQTFGYISDDDIYAALILEEAEKLYNDLTTKLTNEIIAAATAAMKTISSLPLPSANDSRKLIYKNNIYKIEEARYNNNQSETYNNNQEQPNEQQSTKVE
jgi:hypothetical protein